MKKIFLILTAAVLVFGLTVSTAQAGQGKHHKHHPGHHHGKHHHKKG